MRSHRHILRRTIHNGTPTRRFIIIESAVDTLSVYILELRGLHRVLSREIRVDTYAPTFILATFLSRDHHDTVTCTATIQRRSCRAFQYGHTLDIIWGDIRDTGTFIHVTVTPIVIRTTAKVIDRYTVHNNQRLVITSNRVITTNHDTRGTTDTGTILLDLQTSYLTSQSVGHVSITGLRQGLTFQFRHRISQSLFLTLDTQSGYHDFIQGLRIIDQLNLDRRLSGKDDLLRIKTDIGNL